MNKAFKFSVRICLVFLCYSIFSVSAQTKISDFITCVHTSGALVYTKTPSVLNDEFNCVNKRIAANVQNTPKNEKLDPTPNRSEENTECPSKVAIKIDSSGYSGQFVVELRKGARPGSKRISGNSVGNGSAVSFPNICPGTYFYAFGPTDSDDVSVTRYFTVTYDGSTYNNPTITVFYSKSTDSSKRIEKTKKSNL